MNVLRPLALAALAALALAGCEDRAPPTPTVAVAQPMAVPSAPPPAVQPTAERAAPPPAEARGAPSKEEVEFNRPAPK